MFGIFNLVHSANGQSLDTDFGKMNAPLHNFSQTSLPLSVKEEQSIFYAKNYAVKENEIILLFEGLIFNKKKIADDLGIIQTTTTADLLMKAYLAWGTAFVDKLEGEFSIIIYLPNKKEILAFRDPFGVMPLYYVFKENVFYFSSELRRLSCLKQFRQPDETYIKLYFQTNLPPVKDKTWFKAVKRLSGGHNAQFPLNQDVLINAYFKFEPISFDFGDNVALYLEKFQELLQQSVQRRIEGTQRIDAHMSAGLDSTGIAAIAAHYCQVNRSELKTYYCGLKAEDMDNPYGVFDERILVKGISEHSLIPAPLFVTGPSDAYWDKVDNFLNHPLFYTLYNYLQETCVAINQGKGSVLLSGFGGDECVTVGTPHFYLADTLKAGKLGTFIKEGQLFGWKKMLIAFLQGIPWTEKIINIFKPNFKLNSVNAINFPIKETEKLAIPTPPKAYNLTDDLIRSLSRSYFSYRIENEKEFASYYGVEMRYPYLDLQLVSFFLGLPAKLKIYKGANRNFYRAAIKKWIGYEPFVYQDKSKASTIPVDFLLTLKSMDKGLLNYKKIKQNMPEELKAILNVPAPPTNWQGHSNLVKHIIFRRIRQMSWLIEWCKQ